MKKWRIRLSDDRTKIEIWKGDLLYNTEQRALFPWYGFGWAMFHVEYAEKGKAPLSVPSTNEIVERLKPY